MVEEQNRPVGRRQQEAGLPTTPVVKPKGKGKASAKSKSKAASKDKVKKTPPLRIGPAARIRAVVGKADDKFKSKGLSNRVAKVKELLKKKEKEQLLEEVLLKYFSEEELKPYQAELIKLQQHLETTGKKMIVLFDGRDASGKGGTIRRVSRYMNEKRYRVVALGKPSAEQKTELHMKRYIEQFPHAGEITFFDRSWYNRAMVEPVMGFCTKEQYNRFMKKVALYEKNFITDAGKTVLIKIYFSVSKEEQARRFERRRNDPLRQWKLSEVDLQAQELWDEFTQKKYEMLRRTHTKEAPWHIIRSDDKHLARLETIKLILRVVKYHGRCKKLDFSPNPEVIVSGDQELKRMQTERRKYGKFLS